MTHPSRVQIRQLVDGRLSSPTGHLAGWLTDSDTGEELDRQVASSPECVDAALAAADRVHRTETWSGMSWSGRAAHLDAFSRSLEKRAEAIAEADRLDTGVPLSVTSELVTSACQLPRLLGDLAPSLLCQELPGPDGSVDQHWLPWGPAALLTPWNAPAPVAIAKAAFALAARAPVVLKPSEWSPRSASLIAEAAEESGLPPGVFQVVHGGADVGQQLVQDDRTAAVSFTGGVATGRSVALAGAARMIPLDLELSGINPVLVLADADPLTVARQVAAGMCFLNGQWCAAPRRVFVPALMLTDVVEALLDVLQGLAIGHSADPRTDLGPLVHQAHWSRVREQLDALERSGARVHRSGALPELGGHFLQPTVVTGVTGRAAEEIFGPVVQVAAYDDLDAAVAAANDHDFGLSAYVLTADRDAGRTVGQRLRAGLVRVNSVEAGAPADESTMSMWGSSGHGAAGTTTSLRFFTGARSVG